MEIKKILVAVDGSEHSEKGLDIAISLVKETKKEILGLPSVGLGIFWGYCWRTNLRDDKGILRASL